MARLSQLAAFLLGLFLISIFGGLFFVAVIPSTLCVISNWGKVELADGFWSACFAYTVMCLLGMWAGVFLLKKGIR